MDLKGNDLMKAILTTSCRAAAFLFLSFAVVAPIGAQQPEAAGVNELRKQIQELVVIDRSESTPEEVKTLNRKFIRERQARLRRLLEQRIAAMNKYQAAVSGITGTEEKGQIQDAIRDLDKEMKDLDLALSDGRDPSAAAEAATLTRSGDPIPEMVSSTKKTDDGSRPAAGSSTRGRPSTVNRHLSPRPSATLAVQPGAQPASAEKAVEQFKSQLEIEKSNIVDEVVQDVTGTSARERETAAEVFGPLQNPTAFAKILSMNLFPQTTFVHEIESARVDKQVGGPASNAGSTSLVSKGSIPAILGFAVESGGLTRTNQGTTITFRGNPVGLVDALSGKGFIDSYEDDSLTIRRLRKFSFALSYDTSLGDTPNIFAGNRQQLSSYSFRYEFFNHRDPRDARYAAKWAQLVIDNAQPVARDANRVQDLFLRDATLRAWLEEARKAIFDAPDGMVESVTRAKLAELEQLTLSLAVQNAVNNFSQSFSAYRSERDQLLNAVANGPIFTVDYVNSRRPGLIDTSNIKFIYTTGVVEGRASLTLNGDATFFNSHPGPGMKRLRNYDFSTQLDIPLGDPRGFGQFDLSFAGQFKRLAEDEVVDGTVIATKGNIGTFNLKLEVPIKNLGIKFPLAFTYSNRTEFDLKKQLRANFGFAFDPDILYNLLKPFSK